MERTSTKKAKSVRYFVKKRFRRFAFTLIFVSVVLIILYIVKFII
ncbi:hypothetical protein V7112_07715 [Bacillus sp. JJ1566]